MNAGREPEAVRPAVPRTTGRATGRARRVALVLAVAIAALAGRGSLSAAAPAPAPAPPAPAPVPPASAAPAPASAGAATVTSAAGTTGTLTVPLGAARAGGPDRASAPAGVGAGLLPAGVVPFAPARSGAAAPASVTRQPMPEVQRVEWDGQLRLRFETRTLLDYRMPGTFDRPAGASPWERGGAALMRTRVGTEMAFAPDVRGHLGLRDARSVGADGLQDEGEAGLELVEAWVDLDSLAGRALTARVGRQELAYGDGRVLGGDEWANAGREYDGARLRWTPGRARADAFVTWIEEAGTGGRDRVLSGLDVLWRTARGTEFEGYHFERAFAGTGFAGERGDVGGLFDATTGVRACVSRSSLELRVEGAAQRGRRANDRVASWFGVSRLTADLHSEWKTRVLLEHLLASGDHAPADGRFQRFDPMFWNAHEFQGAIDIVGAGNLSDWCAGLVTQPALAWTIRTELHAFSLASATDAWVDDAGTVERRDPSGASGNGLGREVDVSAQWNARPNVAVLGGASRFMAGPYVHATGGGADTAWGFVQLVVSF